MLLSILVFWILDSWTLEDREHIEENALNFLDAQQTRIAAIERKIFGATGDILPSKADGMSVTEMAELCRMVQESNRRQLAQLRLLMEAAGCDVAWNDKWVNEHSHEFEDKKPDWALTRRPLERVSEGDAETEGVITPKSMITCSPFHSESSRKKSLTPTTPTMETLSLRYVLHRNYYLPCHFGRRS